MALPTPSPMIATKTAVLMAAMMIGVVGISVAAAPLVAEANQVNTTRSHKNRSYRTARRRPSVYKSSTRSGWTTSCS
jgi:hypothetical protein